MEPSKCGDSAGSARIPWEYVEAYTLRAAERCMAGDAEGAIVALGRTLSMDPDNESALLIRGALWALKGRPRTAIHDFSKVLALNKENLAAYYQRGEAHQGLGHYRSAIADYSRVLLLQAGHPEALLHRAVLYTLLHQTEQAHADFKHLMEVDPRIARALEEWGVAEPSPDGEGKESFEPPPEKPPGQDSSS